MIQAEISRFIANEMVRGKENRPVPARLQAAMALLEKLRESPELILESHMAKAGSSGLRSHEKYGDLAIERYRLEALNRNHGRRSSDLRNWGEKLLTILREHGFEAAPSSSKARLIDTAQGALAESIQWITNEEPLKARLGTTVSASAVIRQILSRASEKRKAGDVAQYLVGAKLEMRLKIELPKLKANKGDRSSYADLSPRAGDFEIEDAVIEVALGLPDEKHVSQIAEALDGTNKEFWILTRHDRVAAWNSEISNSTDDGIDARRVVVVSVDAFVGQNIAEIGGFAAKGRLEQLRLLFKIYNDVWVAELGVNGIRIVEG